MGGSHLSHSSSYPPDTSEANLKKVGLWKQGRDCCCLSAAGFGLIEVSLSPFSKKTLVFNWTFKKRSQYLFVHTEITVRYFSIVSSSSVPEISPFQMENPKQPLTNPIKENRLDGPEQHLPGTISSTGKNGAA